MKILNTLLVFIALANSALAAKVDTIEVFSTAMNKRIKTVIVQPDEFTDAKLPTVYILHGFGSNYKEWLDKAPIIKQLVDDYKFIAILPDGGHGSWYWDVEGDQNFQYETFVSKELVKYVTSQYPALDDRSKRGITGFSMGGHGSLFLTLRNPEVFGAAASVAGGVDFRPFPGNWDISKRLGEYRDHSEKWNAHTVMGLLHLAKPNYTRFYIDCGTNDFFYHVNEKLHEQMTYLNIPHHYHTMSGSHNWEYAAKSIVYQMAFFNDFFNSAK